ncbi:hypothetical protein NP493_667g00011 [Ridgeia piscesae]|uniref:Metalloendopeptidase n=1 Tax=Ridgeia piscesae TaxID=27915 RepID=A0AAD9KS32_RIDPI|nr:hypothetical protein NP493_667g00011 [Ridgeia piscesae]
MQKCKEIRQQMALDLNKETTEQESESPMACVEDIMMVPSQVDQLLVSMKESRETRTRRKIRRDIDVSRWQLPIRYKVDGNLNAIEASVVEDAIAFWEEGTCLTFERLQLDSTYDSNHILFTKIYTLGCYSYIGNVKMSPQPIFLSYTCFTPGVLAHEIGHALGLIHEHQRYDRDDYISLNLDNIASHAISNFNRFEASIVDTKDLTYDYGSAMHYTSTAFGKRSGAVTIVAKDRLYERTMGQRVELSFYDHQIINLAYCSRECNDRLPAACQHGGYQDPKDCNKCRCPDGWGGRYCDQVATSVGATCGGVLDALPQAQSAHSPRYDPWDASKIYDNYQECSWLIRAPEGKHVTLRFDDIFSVYCANNHCLHWVEIRYKRDLGKSGPRFCCTDRPQNVFTSESNEMLVIFKAKTNVDAKYRRGFKFIYSDSSENTAKTATTTTTTTTTPLPEQRADVTKTRTTTAPRTTTRMPTNDRFDVAIMIDMTSHPGKDHSSLKQLVSNAMSKLHLGGEHARVSVVSFGRLAFTQLSLDEGVDTQAVKRTLTETTVRGEVANYFGALWVMQNSVFVESHGDRATAPNVAVLVTDSRHSIAISSHAVTKSARQARDNGIPLCVVAIDDKVDHGLLEDMTESNDDLFYVGGYSGFRDDSTASWLASKIRQLATTTPPTTTTTATTTPRPTTTTTTTTTPRPTTTTTTATTTTTTPTTTTPRPTTTTTKRTTSTTTTTTTAAPTTRMSNSVGRNSVVSCETVRGSCSQSCGGCGIQRIETICRAFDGKPRR